MDGSRQSAPPSAGKRRPRVIRGLGVGRIFGIELRLDASVVIIFALVVFNLGMGTLAAWHPDWSAALRWSVALGLGVLFFASILLHELAHSVVAKGYGLPVPRITLFLFGGLSEMESEPKRPGQEFLIAVVGPLTSIVLGLLCLFIGGPLLNPGLSERIVSDPVGAMASLGVFSTLVLWLGPINLLLGVFNLVPGFPLDGGRVLRAAIWAATGDRVRATYWASRAGQLVAFVLMGFGVIELFSGRLGGLWLLFIGWFLNNAARSSHAHMVIEETLLSLAVSDLMRTHIEKIPSSMTVRSFIERVLSRSNQDLWPVTDETGHPAGVITLEDVRDVELPEQADQPIARFARPVGLTLDPHEDGVGALRTLLSQGSAPMLVVDDGEVVGLFDQRDIARWLAVAELRGAA